MALSALLVLASADEKESKVTDTKTAEAVDSKKQPEKRGLELGYGGGGHDFGGHDFGGHDFGGAHDFSGGHDFGGGHEHHEHHQKVVTVEKKVAVPYPVEKQVHYAVEKKVPYPVKVHVPQPYPVEKEIHVPYKVIPLKSNNWFLLK